MNTLHFDGISRPLKAITSLLGAKVVERLPVSALKDTNYQGGGMLPASRYKYHMLVVAALPLVNLRDIETKV
ncbi:MAG: hypothetical protein J0M33_11720 [Anaerolineae bacterium]|nr:hypothetical protein [Anaerolineae bacterium]